MCDRVFVARIRVGEASLFLGDTRGIGLCQPVEASACSVVKETLADVPELGHGYAGSQDGHEELELRGTEDVIPDFQPPPVFT
ncbi:hypothetical protein NDU88_003354 [Pleurodeles waltl]|uniref:Uncharacterized protein n=1 Tax=Pleurodeles waltl TaxID=8319 RepID=A0AAV7SG34_PLEWA|nr:hypothetical protein NDU88_003354 [Pleurodeles waltl]